MLLRTRLLARVLTFQTLAVASLSLFVGAGLLIWIRPLRLQELALSLLCGGGALLLFATATLADLLSSTLAEIALRLRHLELSQQAATAEADMRHLRARLRQAIHTCSARSPQPPPAGPPDPDEPEEALPVIPDAVRIDTPDPTSRSTVP